VRVRFRNCYVRGERCSVGAQLLLELPRTLHGILEHLLEARNGRVLHV
jgi:hypothetical protein